MNTLTELQTRFLAILEEAGEDDLSALINTVGGWNGSTDEIGTISGALAGLITGGLLQIATSRDEVSLWWIPLLREDSLALLSSLESLLQWSDAGQLWKWHENVPRAEVLLTSAGVAAARQILSEHGWPQGDSR